MSLYCTIETQFRNPEALLCALMETNQWTAEQIEVHEQAQNLFGYHGDLRPEKANIIIRRKHVGQCSNDIGFQRSEDGVFDIIVSEFDKSKYNESWINKLKQNYSYHAIRLQQEKKGRSVVRTRLPDNKVRVEIKGYR